MSGPRPVSRTKPPSSSNKTFVLMKLTFIQRFHGLRRRAFDPLPLPPVLLLFLDELRFPKVETAKEG